MYYHQYYYHKVNVDLKAKVADNELYTCQADKGKTGEQYQSKRLVTLDYNLTTSSLQWVRLRYIVSVTDCMLYHLIDNLECLSDVQVAEKKLFLVQGDKPQLMNWERFGLRIGVEEDSLSSSETVEVATAALVGGEFKFPKNTVLVSAVYAVTVSKRLLKPLRLEIQHCVDLTGRPGLSKYLKFAIAPVSTPSLPYQFRIIEGGEFSCDSRYGSIERKEFCLVCILGEETTNGDSDEDDEDSSDSSSDSSDGPPGPNNEEEGE